MDPEIENTESDYSKFLEGMPEPEIIETPPVQEDPGMLNMDTVRGMVSAAVPGGPAIAPFVDEDVANVGASITGGAAGAFAGSALGPVGAVAGGVLGSQLAEGGFRAVTGQEQKDVGTIALESFFDVAVPGLLRGAGALVKATTHLSDKVVKVLLSAGKLDALPPAKMEKALAGETVKITAAEAKAVNSALDAVNRDPSLLLQASGDPVLSLLSSEVTELVQRPTTKKVLSSLREGTSYIELPRVVEASKNQVGQALEVARSKLTDPMPVKRIQELITNIEGKVGAAYSQVDKEAQRRLSKYTITQGVDANGSPIDIVGEFAEPLIEKARTGTATWGDIINLYRSVNADLAELGARDVGQDAKGVIHLSALEISGTVKALREIKNTINDLIGDAAKSDPLLKQANDLSKEYADLSELETILKISTKPMRAAVGGAPIESALSVKGKDPGFTPVTKSGIIGKAGGLARAALQPGSRVPASTLVGDQNLAIPEALSVAARGEGIQGMPEPLAIVQRAREAISGPVGGMTGPVLRGAYEAPNFFTSELQPNNSTPVPLQRMGSPKSALASISMAIMEDDPATGGELITRLEETMGAGSEIDQYKVMGAILATSPKARSLFAPGLTPAKSEYNGIIADPAEKQAMISQLRNFVKAGSVGTIEAAEFKEKLNTDTPFTKVPAPLARKTDPALAPFFDPVPSPVGPPALFPGF